jgi:hypothetical protein
VTVAEPRTFEDARVSEISRRLRSRADGILAAVWFMPAARTGFTELGLSPAASGLPSRAACLGRVTAEVAASLLAPINPVAVMPAFAEAWRATDPESLLAARLRHASDHLAVVIGEDPPGIDRAVELLRPVAEAGSLEGHAVYAGLRSVPWPGDPLGDLWRACDMVRERRGGSHLNAWVSAGVDPVEINVLSELWRDVPLGSVTTAQMAWSTGQMTAALERLRDRGLVEGEQLTPAGRELRDTIEVVTDRQERALVDALGDDVDELFGLLGPWARAVVTSGASQR